MSGILKGRISVVTATTMVRCTEEGIEVLLGLHVVMMTEGDRLRQTTPDHHNGVRTGTEAECHLLRTDIACLRHQQTFHVGLTYRQVAVRHCLRL